VTVATVNDKVQLQSVRTWFDPLDMFRQIAPDGVVKKEAVDKKLSPSEAMDTDKAAEIDQKPHPAEKPTTTLPSRTVEGSKDAPTAATMQTPEAERLVAATGSQFAGTDPKDAEAFVKHETGAEAIAALQKSQGKEGVPDGHPNVDQEQPGAGCPFMGTANQSS
jgi:hypothetical protein